MRHRNQNMCAHDRGHTIFRRFSIGSTEPPPTTLTTQSRGLYANMQGVYVSNFNGSLSFFSYDGWWTSLLNASTEVTNINAATRNGLITVHYYLNQVVIFSNNGTPWNPALVQNLQLVLLGAPYDSFVTSQYIYITYCDSRLLFSVHHRSNGSVLYVYNTSALNYRPVVSQWQDKIIVMDKDIVTEYHLNGTYTGNFMYAAPVSASQRNYFHHDYAGRRYVCNSGGSSPGVHAFLLNGTRLAVAPQSCTRAVQVYFTKEQVVSVVGSPALKRIINIP